MCLKSGPPDLFLTLFSVNYVTDCVINMLSIWCVKHNNAGEQLNYKTMFFTGPIKPLKNKTRVIVQSTPT